MPLSHPFRRPITRRSLVVAALCAVCMIGPMPARAEDTQDPAAPAGGKAPVPSALVTLINRLAARGVLTKQDAEDLGSMAEADAADARVEAAEARLAAAKAEAAAARARAALARATVELELARANAAQLSANQAAAVRLLLGQGRAAAPVSSPADGVASDAATPAPAESIPVADARLSAASRAGNASPEPADSSAPDKTTSLAAASTAAESPAADAPDAGSSLATARPAGGRNAALESTDSSPAVATEAQPAPAPASAAEAPAESSSLKLTRNEDGAIVVPDETEGGRANSTVASSDQNDTPAAAPVETAKAEAPADTATTASPSDNSAEAADAPTDAGAAPMADAQATPAPASGETKANNLAPNADGAVEVPEETEGGQARSATVSSDLANPPAATSLTDAAAAPAETSGALSEPANAELLAKGDDPEQKADPSGSDPGPIKMAAEAPASATTDTPTGGVPAGSNDDVVRVAYVPEVVRNQIRDEVKNEVIAEARKENWGSPSSGPEWVSRFTLYGDIRVRAEEVINHAGNDNTGAFPNFNAINTGAPFDTAGNVFSPQYNVDQNRNRERLRARLGFAVDVADGFTAGLRLATGNDNNPVTENQTFGAAGNAQGGDFAKYSLWLDRAYIRYQSPGDSGQPFWMSFGRFDNPFFSTSLVWANDIGFDGFAVSVPVKAQLSSRPAGDFKPFFVAGAFPVFNTDLNYATNSPVKYKSYDKWLYAGQLGFDAKLSGDYQLKAAAALYEYKNIEGQLSSPFTPLTTSDAGDTDASRPSFAQNGNTYMALRDIVPGPLNNNGTIDQFQYYGLATPFKEFALTEGLYYNHFEPFQISLVSEWVRNLAFNQSSVAAVAVNNGGPSNFIGGNTGWISTLKFGSAVIQDFGDWNASIGYRRIESDAVVDGFNDADFGGVLFGTNLKGYTLTASFALAHGVWIDARWMDASAIAGPIFRNDLLQLDLNTKF